MKCQKRVYSKSEKVNSYQSVQTSHCRYHRHSQKCKFARGAAQQGHERRPANPFQMLGPCPQQSALGRYVSRVQLTTSLSLLRTRNMEYAQFWLEDSYQSVLLAFVNW